jgi:hypothetical protein
MTMLLSVDRYIQISVRTAPRPCPVTRSRPEEMRSLVRQERPHRHATLELEKYQREHPEFPLTSTGNQSYGE